MSKTRICIIGNSHAGALYKAWRTAGSHYGDVTIDFFIDRSSGTKPLIIRSRAGDTTLPSMKMIAVDVLDTSAYDAFFFCALGFGPRVPALTYRDHRAEGHRCGPGEHLVSAAAFRAATVGGLRSTKAVAVLTALRAHTDRPAVILGQPRLSAHVLQAPESVLTTDRASLGTEDEASIERYFLEAATRVCAGLHAEFIDQPAATLQSPLLTRGEYGLADPKDNSQGSAFALGDFWHMNPQFGLAVINQVLVRMGCKLKDGPLPPQGPWPPVKQASLDGYSFHPRDEFGIAADACRLVVFDDASGQFCLKKQLPSGAAFFLRGADLPAGFHGRFKIQVQEEGKWVDKVPYQRLLNQDTPA